MTRFKGDDNYKAAGVVGGYSSADSDTELAPTLIPLRVDPVTKRLLVDASVSIDTTGLATETKQDDIITAIEAIPGGGGVQYTEGDTDATITGTALMWEDAANALVAASAAKPLPVSATIDTTGLATTTTDTNTGTIAGAVSGGHMQADVLTMPTITVNSHAVTNAGTFVVQIDGAALTSLQLIDNLAVAVDGNYLNVNSNIAGTDIVGGAGAVAAGVQRVTLASDDPAVTSLQLIDNAISGAGFNITQLGGANVPIGAGLEATAVRVTLPTNGTGIVGLAAGSNAIGKLAANSGIDIGDVDVISIIPGVGATNLGKALDSAKGATDTGVMMLAIRDDTLSVFANAENDFEPLHLTAAGRLYTSATIDAALPAGTNNIGDIDVLTIAAGDNNIGNVDIVTVPADPFGANADAVVAAGAAGSISAKLRAISRDIVANIVLAAGSNAIGKLAANSGVDIGDIDVTSILPGTGATNLGKAEDAGHTSGDVGVMALGIRTDVPNAANPGSTADYAGFSTDMVGGIRTALYETDFAVLGTAHVKKYYTNAGAVTDGIVWSPAGGKRWYVTDIFIQVSAAATVTLEDDLSGGDSPVWKAELAANSGWSHSFSTPLFSGEDAADLMITTSAGNVYVTVTGYEI